MITQHILSCILLMLVSCLLTVSASSVYGDFTVVLSKDTIVKKQLNIFKGDYFLVQPKLRGIKCDALNDDGINRLTVTQSVEGLSEDKNVKFVLEKIENELFNVTSVSPVNNLGGSVVSSSNNPPHRYITKLVVNNNTDTVLAKKCVRTIVLSSYGIVTNSGIQVKFYAV